jgi:hypothetical protein
MSLTARLHIEGHSQQEKGIKILSCDFSFSQDVDNRGMASSNVRAGLINVTIPGINDNEIIQWMLSRDDRKKGKITFSGVVDTGPHRSVEFEDAVLVSYHESFSDQSDIMISLTISPRIIKVTGVKHESLWAPTE